MLNLYDHFLTDEELEIAENNGINKYRAAHRVRQEFWSKERAINEPVKKKGKPIDKKYLKIAESNGISYNTFKSRLRNGWSLEKAANTPKMSHKEVCKKVGKRSKYPDWVFEKLKENNISKNTFYARMSKNKYTLEEACTMPIADKVTCGVLGRQAYDKIECCL